MSKQIQVNLAFNAETAKAKQQINDLVDSLNKISTKNSQIFDDKNLKDAASAAKDLTKHLEASVNVNTGKLDLNKFTQSLTQSKISLTDLYNQLSKAGPEGQKAFSQLSSAIASSDSSVLNLNAKVKDLGQTLKNTIKWQLSSSLVHGFMGAMSQAIGYAKDLNSSLNDIRIVTGASVDEMARFAEQANKSAKALSSTTTEYTKASLIYYQQGLSDSEVKERTDVTIKMANVSKESAQVVSDQMTAVWNNFYDGSKSLEYYADVMTALGAATASSVDEIAGGLEKFAAIGDTIGLSYEYAASALATITSNTRQSEEVVGTALKTIFARIQGLNLGETLDDGTTLNKYSAALEKVGISIFDQAGEIKNMDNILSEMGDKWQDLSKDQQIALAQTVAGTRQYTQLVALMDNWNNGDNDSFQANLQTAYGAEGTLQEQQDIYAESWEAAADRVKAATEDIYDSLINDEAIVVLLNGLEKILSFTGALIDGFGGLKGILLLVAGIFTRQIANEVPEALGKLKQNFEILTGKGQENKIKTLEEVATLRKPGENGPKEGTGAYTRAMADSQQASQMAELERIHSQLTDAQYNSAKAKIDEARASAELVANLQDEIAKKEKLFKQNKRNVKVENDDKKVSDRIKELDEEIGSTDEDKQAAEELYRSTRAKKQSDLTADEAEWMASYERRKAELETLQQMDGTQTINQAIQGQMDKLAELYGKWSSLNQVIDDYQAQIESFGASVDIIKSAGGINTEKGAQEFNELTNSMKNYLSLLGEIDGVNVDIDSFDEAVANIKKLENTEEAEKAIENLISSFHKFANIQIVDGQITQIGEEAIDAKGRMQKLENQIDEVRGALEGLTPEQFEKLAAAAEEAGIEIAGLQVALRQQQNSNQQKGTPTQDSTMEFSTALTKVAGLGMDVASLFSSLGSALSVCFDQGTSAGEKFIAVLSSMPAAAMSIAQIIGALKDMPDALKTVSEGFSKLKEFSVTGSALAGMFGKMGTAMQAAGSSGGALGGIIAKLGGVFAGATTSVTAFWISLGWITLAIAAVVAAVLLAVKAFQAWKASTPEGKLEAAKKATEGMADAAREADQAYKDLLNTINSYEDAANALDGLTEGTQEFTNKLLEANNYARELIDTYNLMPDDYFVNDQGLIKFKSGVFEGKQNEYQQQAEKTQLLYQSSQRYQNQQENAVAANDGRLQLYYNSGASSAWTTQQFQDLYKGIFESAGSLEGFKAKGEKEGGYQEQRDILIKSLFGENASWDTLDETYQGMIDATLNSLDSFAEYEKTFQANATDNANSVKTDIITSLSNEDIYQSSAYKSAIVEATAKGYDNALAEAKTRWDNEGEDAKDDADIEKAFAEYLGDQNYTQKDGKVYDKEGNEITELSNLSIEAQREILAGADAVGTLADEGVQLAEGFNKAAKTMSEDEKALADAMFNGNLNSLTKERIESLKAMGDISPEDIFDKETLNTIRNNPYLNNALNDWFENFKQNIESWEPPKFDLEKWKADYAASKDIVSGLEVGDTIDQSKYDQLDAAAQQFFTNTGDGIYTLTQNAELLRDVVNDIAAQKLKDEIAEINNLGGMSQKTANQHAANIEAGNASGDVFLNGEKDEAYIEDVNAKYGKSFTEFAEAVAYVNEKLGELQSNLAATADKLGELDNLMTSGQISGGDYINQLQVLATQYENCADELANYQRALEEGNEEAANAADAALHGAIRAGELAKQYDLSAKAIERYAEELKDSGKYVDASSQALVEMAKDQLRFDRAVENSRENIKKWKQDLQIAAKTGNLASESAEQMAQAYGDLLDIDGDLLPSSFLKDADNLKLMEQALKGNEEAYQSLLDKSRQDIAMKIGLDDTAFQNGFNDLLNEYYQAQSLDDIQVGASLDNAGFLQGLTEMVNAANMTAEEATSYLASMGVDANVITKTETKKDVVATSLKAITGEAQRSYYVPAADGTPQEMWATFPTVSYSTEPVYDEKAMTGVALEVTSANKSSGGAIKHSGSTTAAAPSSSGGGGGGGSSRRSPVHAEKKSSSDRTRYHTLQNQLEDLTSEYDALAEASSRAFGKKKLDAIDAEIKKTDELIDKQKEYVSDIRSNLSTDKKTMTSYYDKIIGGPAMEFDANGNISNYDQIEKAMQDKYNKMAAKYDKDSPEWQAFEKQYEKVKKYIEQYESTYDLLRDEEAEYQKMLDQRIDLELAKVEYKVEIELEVPENAKEIIQYQLGQIENDARKTGETLALLTRQAELTYDQMAINRQGLNEALGLSLSDAEINELMAGNMSVLDGKNFTEDQINAIKQYRDNLLQLNEQFNQIRESIEATVMQAFEMWNAKLDEGIQKIDYFGAILEGYQSIISIVGRDTLGISDSLMKTLSQAGVDNAINGVQAAKDTYDALRQSQIEAEEELEKAKARGDERSIEHWEKTLSEIESKANSAHENMIAAWQEALNKIVEQFEASIQIAVDAFNEAVYQLGGIEALSNEFDRQKEMADMYLDDYQQIYELSKLNRDINNSIDDTDSLVGKQKLKKLLAEINKLQEENVEMSQYDLEYLQAEYDLRLAEIALEEAQRAKDVVRLSRDNEGNWSYVYTQNTEAVDDAQQKYEDALYAMQDLSSNYIDEISAQLIKTSQEMQEALAAIRVEDYASIEEYYSEVERIQAQYEEKMAKQEDELNKAIANNKELYDTDWKNYHNATGYKIADTEEFVTKFSDSLLGVLTNSESDVSDFGGILAKATASLVGELYKAADQYYTNVSNAMEAAGTSTGEFARALEEDVKTIKKESEEAAEAVEKMAKDMQKQMDDVMEKVGEWQRTYGAAMDEIIQSNLAVIESFDEMIRTLSTDNNSVTITYDIQSNNNNNNGGSNNSSSNSSNNNRNSNNSNSSSNSNSGNRSNSSSTRSASSMDTGGYTGSWGDEGKLAILHEKELVLNKEDTKNFISALKISRNILNTIDLNARQASLGLGAMAPATIRDDIKETLEQVVSIAAEFPNATDRNEIEEAFNMLINRASQFANRK